MTNSSEERFWQDLRDGLAHAPPAVPPELFVDTESSFDAGFSMEDAERLLRSDAECDGEPLSEHAILEMVRCAVASPPARVAQPRLVIDPSAEPPLVRSALLQRPMPVDYGPRSRVRRLALTSHWLAASVTGAALLLAFGTVMTLWPNQRETQYDLTYAMAIDVMMGLDPGSARSQGVAAGRVYTHIKRAVDSLGAVRNQPGSLGTSADTGLKGLAAVLQIPTSPSAPHYVEAASLIDLAERLVDSETTGREALAEQISLQALYGVQAMVALQQMLPPGKEDSLGRVLGEQLRRLQRRIEQALGQ